MAGADDRPTRGSEAFTRSPKASYCFRALRFAGEVVLDRRSRFAACAFPAPGSYSSGTRWTYILNEENTIWRKDLGPASAGPEVFPDDPAKEGWVKSD